MDSPETQYVALSVQELQTVRQALEHFTVNSPYPMDRQLAQQALDRLSTGHPISPVTITAIAVSDVDGPPIAARI
jgi:hypothetical protein